MTAMSMAFRHPFSGSDLNINTSSGLNEVFSMCPKLTNVQLQFDVCRPAIRVELNIVPFLYTLRTASQLPDIDFV